MVLPFLITGHDHWAKSEIFLPLSPRVSFICFGPNAARATRVVILLVLVTLLLPGGCIVGCSPGGTVSLGPWCHLTMYGVYSDTCRCRYVCFIGAGFEVVFTDLECQVHRPQSIHHGTMGPWTCDLFKSSQGKRRQRRRALSSRFKGNDLKKEYRALRIAQLCRGSQVNDYVLFYQYQTRKAH